MDTTIEMGIIVSGTTVFARCSPGHTHPRLWKAIA